MSYRVIVRVREVRGYCAAGYEEGDSFEIRRFYIESCGNAKICLHALSSMLTLLSPFLKGVPAEALGIGKGDLGYVQCPDPGRPYTCGGTVIFELRREPIE
mgnify:CR=1 FL=1